MKKTRKTKVTLAVTFQELPDGWSAATAAKYTRDMLCHGEQDATLPDAAVDLLHNCTVRVQSTVEETVYDASVAGKRGGRRDASAK